MLSNASTTVKVAGEEMTVAEAIAMKNFIAYYESVLNTMTVAYTRSRHEFKTAQARVTERLDKLAMEVLGKNPCQDYYVSIAQRIEQQPSKLRVPGSSPGGDVKIFVNLRGGDCVDCYCFFQLKEAIAYRRDLTIKSLHTKYERNGTTLEWVGAWEREKRRTRQVGLEVAIL